MSAHHEELQEIENVKHLWRNGGKWLFVLLLIAALGYLGNVIYKGYIKSQQQEAAVLASQVQGDTTKLATLQQQYRQSAVTAKASLEMAKSLFDAGKFDEAAAQYRWILENQKTPLFQASAIKNLATVLMQQKKFDEALTVLNTPIEDSFVSVIDEVKGDVLAAQGKNKEAIAAYQSALNKLPENSANRELLVLKMAQL